MNRHFLLLATIGALFAVGCASVEPQSAEASQDKRYVTGSRIPARDGNTSAEVKSVGNRDAIDDITQRSRVFMPAKGAPTQ